jgi:hypothetical protein
MAVPIESACWRLWACSEALASLCASASCYRCTEDVAVVAIIKAKLKLIQVERQVLLADVMVRPDHAALEQGPERFDVVGMHFAAHVLAAAMADDFVREEISQFVVSARFIGRHQADFLGYSLFDKAAQGLCGCIFDDLAHHIALPRNRANNGRFASVSRTATAVLLPVYPVPVLLLAADLGFIDLDNAHQLPEVRIAESGAEPMAHIESRPVGTCLDGPMNLECADSLLAGQNQEQNPEPSAHGNLGILENRPDEHREAVSVALDAFGIPAFPLPSLLLALERIDLFAASATRTYNTLGPALVHQVGAAGIFVGKHPLKLRKGHLQRESGDVSVALLCHDSIIARDKLSVNRCIAAKHFCHNFAAKDFIVDIPARLEDLLCHVVRAHHQFVPATGSKRNRPAHSAVDRLAKARPARKPDALGGPVTMKQFIGLDARNGIAN